MDSQLSSFLRLSSIIEAMPDALVIIDNTGRIILINSHTEHLFEYPRDELIGEYVEHLMPERYRNKHPQHRDNYFKMPKVRAMGSELELFGVKKNGTEFPIDISLSPLNTDEGLFALAAIRDITIRKKAEAKFKSILEATPDCLIVINDEGKIVLINERAQAMFGHTPEEVRGQYIEFLIPERFHNNHIKHRGNYFSTPGVRPMGSGLELYGQHKRGHEFPVEISLSPLETEEGFFALAEVRDITEQKLLKDQLYTQNESLERQNRLKTEFLANLSHDIRTPLTGVIGLAKLVENLATNPEQKQYTQWLGQSGEQLLTMLTLILDSVSEENTDESHLNDKPFKLEQVIQEIRNLVLPSTITRGINFKTHIDENIPSCLVSDHNKIRRILLNLIGNAIKFTQQGEVALNVKLIKQMKNQVLLNFSVKDTGIGIPYELQDKVFGKFYRIPSKKGTYSGHGLGLHIAQSYTHLLGGKLQLSSKPGVGTTFYFDLLINIGDLAQAPLNNDKQGNQSPSPIRSNIKNTNAPKLLLVEDNLIALFTLEALVHQAGFSYKSTNNGKHALDLIKSEPFDLMITDLGIPGLSGIELAEKIRAYEKKHHRIGIPIIGLTAHDEKKIMAKCIKAGMNSAMSKPIDLQALEKIRETYLIPTKAIPLTEQSTKPQRMTKGLKNTLADNEKNFIQLNDAPLLDIERALINMGNNLELLKNTLRCMAEQELMHNRVALEQAYAIGDWAVIEKLAHQMKGGLIYCGAFKLVNLCQYIENYYLAGQRKRLKVLYKQFCKVINETKDAINQWLLQNEDEH